ncbi:hypothetical protein ACROYT_G036018 [Oculina patagonica]
MEEIVRAIGEAVGAAREAPEVNRPPGVVYAKCVLKYSLSGAWAFGTAYIIGKYNADPQQMINIFNKVALPAGIILIGMSRGCLKLSLRADSLSSLKELWKRYTEGVLQNDLRQALLTPDLLHFAEAGQNVELEVQIDDSIYQEACMDLITEQMVKRVLQVNQNSRSTSLLNRRSLSDSNLAVYSNNLNKELLLQAKPQVKQEKQPKIIDEPFPVSPDGVPNVLFLNIDDETVFEQVEIYDSTRRDPKGISDGTVQILASPTSQISGIKVWVFREVEAAKLCEDKHGKQELPAKIGKTDVFTTHFSVNLDDVHSGPFYTLAKIDPQRRNVFQLSSRLHFIDGTVSEEFFSKPFRIRTKEKRTRTDEPTITTSVSSHPLSGQIKVHTLVCDRVIASNVQLAEMLLSLPPKKFDFQKFMVTHRKETFPSQPLICTDLVRVDNLIARQVECITVSTSMADIQGPQVDLSEENKADVLIKSLESGYAKELTSPITANVITVERLIVRHLTANTIQISYT